MMNFHFLVSLTFLSFAAFSAETDNFTNRDKPQRDAANIINSTINDYLEKVTIAYNKNRPDVCDSNKILELLRLNINTNYPEIYGKLEEDNNLDKMQIPNGSSVYGEKRATACCASTVTINNHKLGLDKIDHMLSHGLPYYQIVKATGKLDSALDLGRKQEDGCWGLACNGVKSYGDLAANYQGYLFWSNMTDGANPYIKCVGNEFKLVRNVDIRDYVDDSFDEAINCSSFDNQKRADGILKNMKALGYESCPISPSKCEQLVKKYPKTIANKILHPACLNQGNKKISFVEREGSEDGLDWIDTIKMGTQDVKLKNLLKGIGIK